MELGTAYYEWMRWPIIPYDVLMVKTWDTANKGMSVAILVVQEVIAGAPPFFQIYTEGSIGAYPVLPPAATPCCFLPSPLLSMSFY